MKHKIIGKGERRVDALGKVTGTAKFAEDYNVMYQLYGKVLRAKYQISSTAWLNRNR